MSLIHAPIHDLLIRIKNAYMARRTSVPAIPHSVFKENVLNLLKQYKFIAWYTLTEDNKKKFITIDLNSIVDPIQDIPHITFFSKPSRPYYIGWKQIKNVAWGSGIGLLSTNQWLMASHEAKKKKIWGELIAEIY